MASVLVLPCFAAHESNEQGTVITEIPVDPGVVILDLPADPGVVILDVSATSVPPKVVPVHVESRIQADAFPARVRRSPVRSTATVSPGDETVVSRIQALAGADLAQGKVNGTALALCGEGLNYVGQTTKVGLPMGEGGIVATAASRVTGDIAARARQSLCRRIAGQKAGNADGVLHGIVDTSVVPAASGLVQSLANNTGLPLLARLEVNLGHSEDGVNGSVATVQPLWNDSTRRHFLLSELSYHVAGRDTDANGFRTSADTANAGLVYRTLSPDETLLLGANGFLSYAPEEQLYQGSFGLEARTSAFGVSANIYRPIGGPIIANGIEKQAASGWDLTLKGQLPDLPRWTLASKAYSWDQLEGRDIHGMRNEITYSPIRALVFRAGLKGESGSPVSFDAGVALNWTIGMPLRDQLSPVVALQSLRDQVNTRVERTNTMRITQRRIALVPSGYTVSFTTAPLNATNAGAAELALGGAEVGASYSYTITSSGGGTPVTGTGTVTTANQSLSSLNLSGLGDGTLSASVTLSNVNGTGTAATATVVKATAVPSGYTVSFTTAPLNVTNAGAAALALSGAEVGASYSYSITSSGGGTPVTGTGTVTTANQSLSSLNLSGLGDGTLSASVTLGNVNGTGAAATATVVKDTVVPSVSSVQAPANGTYNDL